MEKDFSKAIWYTEQCINFNEDHAQRQCEYALRAVGQKGMLGTWFSSPFFHMENENSEAMFYHLEDWPELAEELFYASCRLKNRKMEIYQKSGFDFLFYVISGTEMVSPWFLRKWTLDESKAFFNKWREAGGFILLHTCGHVKKLVEEGFYNGLMPDILETLSEPPVGNLPSLKWARKRVDKKIITKGNIPLDTMLNGSVEEVRQHVAYIKDETAGYRHIVGLSDDILHNTPLNNLLAMVDEARR